MAANKTKQSKLSPASFIAKLANAQQRQDSKEGPSIVGFGTLHYVYESGREGDICLTGFSPRKPKKLDDVHRDVLRALVVEAVKSRASALQS